MLRLIIAYSFYSLLLHSASSTAEQIDYNKIPIYQDRIDPQWLDGGQQFWYRVQRGNHQDEFVLINTHTGDRKVSASFKELGLPEQPPLQTAGTHFHIRKTVQNGPEVQAQFFNDLPEAIRVFWVNGNGERIEYGTIEPGKSLRQNTYQGHVWLFKGLGDQNIFCIATPATKFELRINGAGLEQTSAPDQKNRKGPYSPNGKFLARCETIPAPERIVTIIESSPADQLQPRLKAFNYYKPGDQLPQPVWKVDQTSNNKSIEIDNQLFPNPFAPSGKFQSIWAPDSSEFYFDYNQRGHQLYRILAVDPLTANVRIVVEETSATFIDYTNKTWREWLFDTGELIWMSERSGWAHLYLYDIATGSVKNPITKGDWPVREVLAVDAANRQIWFLASGRNPPADPYHLHLCRVNFDGSGFLQLTASDGNHQIQFSPDKSCFIAEWSRVDQPPVFELRRSVDGKLITVLETADHTELLAAGWQTPERFTANGRDGQTDIYGIIIKPRNFSPAKKYPVIEEIYAGPHSAFVPRSFNRLSGLHELADKGFVIVKADGMGTNHRGKVFHDVCWKNLKDAGFPDRIAWIKAAAQTRPWMDLNRVGIYGGSAGGQSALRALLDHHDFYHVAVADCGCHDNRMDKIWWNEQWLGWPVDESYRLSSNAEDAHKMKGQLLLIVGELDTNVDPASTLQVVGALQKAGKRFKFMPIIGAGHGAAETRYGNQIRTEFLIRHLQP